MSDGLRALLPFLLSLVALFGAWRTAAAAPPVLVVMSEQGGAYEETFSAIQAGLKARDATTEVGQIDWQTFATEPLDGNRLIITVGTHAAQAVSQRDPARPVLHTLIPRDTFERLPAGRQPAPRSAILLDQPVRRQIALLTEALPDWTRLAMLAGPRSESLARELAEAAGERGIEVVTETVNSDRELYPALQRVLTQPAVLLALPDAAVYNSYTIQNVLLTAYRHRSPLVGFSPSYVRAGALLALYSTPTQIGEQAAEAAHAALKGGKLPGPRGPRDFMVGINQNVARSLGINLAPEEVIAARLAQLEGTR